MRKLRVSDGQSNKPSFDVVSSKNILPTARQVEPMTIQPKYITQEQFDIGLNGIVEKLAHRLEPDSALTPEVRGVVKAVGEIQGLRLALKDPTSAGIEEATSTLVTTVLANALSNITNTGQHAVVSKPLKNTLAEIAIHNLTGENSPLPQILDAFTNVLGVEKVKKGYDTGMQYIEQQQTQNNLPNFVLQLDENSQEHVVLYAQRMGYTDVQYAQERLIEHKNRLYQEVDEYQKVQQGKQQTVNDEPIYQETDEVYEEPYVDKQKYEESVIEKPVMKLNKVVILHSKPKKLVLAEDKKQQNINKEIMEEYNTNNSYKNKNNNENNNENNDENNDELSDIDNIIEEIGE